jgi:hypothetical protein
MRRERTATAAVIAAVLTIIVGWVAPRSVPQHVYSGIHPDRFWTLKLRWGPEHDVVLLGDSRVYRGLSPQAMTEALPGQRIINFGFSSAALSPDYLDHGRGLLDPASASPTVVLGVRPYSLTPKADAKNAFRSERNRSPTEAMERLYLTPLLDFFAPFDADRLNRPDAPRYFHRMTARGWVASHKPRGRPQEAVERYADVFVNNRVSPAIAEALVERITAWTHQGIAVYAFRPPTSAAMVSLENDASGFEQLALPTRVRAAGGRWLEVDAARYSSYDGSHLTAASAVALSKDLDRAIHGRAPLATR